MDPAIRPALQRIIDQTAQAAPTETMVQNPPMPNPVDVKRGEYLQRGTLPLILLAAPLAALAANAPLVAIIAATALLWLLLTLAYNTEPQLEREGKRGGERKNSDSWIRVATFPWHLVKALLLAIPRILLLVIIYMAGTAVATAALALPVHTISWYFTADWGIPVPLLNDVPFSASGLALGGFMAIGWLVTVFAPQSMMIRLGGRRTARAQTQSPGGRAIHRSGWGSTCSSGAGAKGGGARHRAVHHMGHHHRGLVRDADSGHADQLDAVRLERGGISHISHPHTWPLCIRYVRSVTLLQGIHLRSALGAVLLRPGHYDGAQTLKRLQGDSYVRSEASGQACHTR